MSLKLQPKPTFKIPVSFFDADGTELGSANFDFNYKGSKELKEFWNSVGTDAGPKDDIDAILRLTAATDAVSGKLTREALEEFCAPLASAPAQIIQAYMDAVTKAKRKN